MALVACHGLSVCGMDHSRSGVGVSRGLRVCVLLSHVLSGCGMFLVGVEWPQCVCLWPWLVWNDLGECEWL